mgnify:FL=1
MTATSYNPPLTMMTPKRVVSLVAAVILCVVAIIATGSLIEVLDAGHIMVIQYPNGTLLVGADPGIYPQWFGSVTRYPKREQFWFSAAKDQGREHDQSIAVTFNDGGRARVSGGLAWEMPRDPKNVIALHVRYRSAHAIETQLIRTVVEKTVNFTGPLMSSTESYAARKNDLLFFIEDQLNHGVYRTESQQVRAKDAMTGIERTVTQVTLVKSADGKATLRQDASPLDEFGIRVFNLAINNIIYDATVADQIRQQQEAFAKVATAIARAKEAEQDAITVEKRGQANAAEAKWKQEVVKAQQVTEAEMRKRVAELDAEAAAATKRKLILEGEGEAAKRLLVMQADGALERKLATYERVQGVWAGAFKEFKGALVPQIVTGPSGGAPSAGGNAALDFMGLMGMKAARDLSLDLSTTAGPKR